MDTSVESFANAWWIFLIVLIVLIPYMVMVFKARNKLVDRASSVDGEDVDILTDMIKRMHVRLGFLGIFTFIFLTLFIVSSYSKILFLVGDLFPPP